MKRAGIERIVNAVLYEGYLLYPYRASALKNRKRWNFGCVFPPAWSREHPDDRSAVQAEVLVAGEAPRLAAWVRFLDIAGETPVEREVEVAGAAAEFEFGPVRGRVQVEIEDVSENLRRLRVRVGNTAALETSDRDAAQRAALASTHILLGAEEGEFVSLMDSPEGLRNEGLWPVLVGKPGERNVMLCSPVILYDYPQVASESAGDLFDATEIDEILSLRILTLTDEEKREMRADERARRILERTEALGAEEMVRLHGARRDPGGPAALKKGDRVRLWPRRTADIMDIALKGKIGIVEAIERDFEDRVHVAVVIEDDPGRDLGEMRQPGHRFFFSPDEVEPLVAGQEGA